MSGIGLTCDHCDVNNNEITITKLDAGTKPSIPRSTSKISYDIDTPDYLDVGIIILDIQTSNKFK